MIDSRWQQVPTRLLVAVVPLSAGFAAIAAAARASSSSTTTIGSRHEAGVVLASPHGQVLFLFNRDRDGKSSCYGRCAREWRPLRAFGPVVAKAGSGVKQRRLSTTRRRDGTLQVTYDHFPLYVNVGNKPGSLNIGR